MHGLCYRYWPVDDDDDVLDVDAQSLSMLRLMEWWQKVCLFLWEADTTYSRRENQLEQLARPLLRRRAGPGVPIDPTPDLLLVLGLGRRSRAVVDP